jgi:poly-gamma-glutamate capsule biosynthesis protein CapA/YwtB (metallophosphatase superfamily)
MNLLRRQDVTLANLECAIPDPDDPPAFVAGTGWAATYMAGTPAMLEDLKFMGIDGVGAANNHVGDFGASGILSTIRHLDEAEIPYSGIGASLRESSEPAYFDTSTGPRVAYVSVCDWGPRGAMGLGFPWPAGYMPSDEMRPFRSRPGINLLRYEAVSRVSREQLEQLRSISGTLKWDRDKVFRRHGYMRAHPLVGHTTNLEVEQDGDDVVYFLGRRFVAADEPGHDTTPCNEDLDRNIAQIREARRQADIVLVSLHDQSHGAGAHDYVTDFAHAAIDAGADVFFNNGGSLMGVEVYRGKAIIYGVPSFCLQTEGVKRLPGSMMERFGLPATAPAGELLDVRESWRQTAFASAGGSPSRMLDAAGGSAIFVCEFDEASRLREVIVRPIQPLGGAGSYVRTGDNSPPLPRFRRGLPSMPAADSDLPTKVIQHVAVASEPFGTVVVPSGDIGTIRMSG